LRDKKTLKFSGSGGVVLDSSRIMQFDGSKVAADNDAAVALIKP